MIEHAQSWIGLGVEAQRTISHDVCQRRQIEACGLLLGRIEDASGGGIVKSWHVERALPLPNTYNSPSYFEFAPEDLLEAELRYGASVVGVYHSHPGGLAVASSTDMKNMRRVNLDQRIPWAWVIVSGPFAGFEHALQRPIAGTSIVAYHHFDGAGLRSIRIRYEADTRAD